MYKIFIPFGFFLAPYCILRKVAVHQTEISQSVINNMSHNINESNINIDFDCADINIEKNVMNVQDTYIIVNRKCLQDGKCFICLVFSRFDFFFRVAIDDAGQ
eukprot:298659_1